MAKILNFEPPAEGEELPENKDLTALLKKVKKGGSKTEFNDIREGLAITDMEEFEKVVKGKISDILFQHQMLEAEYFLCGEYVAKLLIATIQNPPASWYAVDYLLEAQQKQDYTSWRKAADLCFLICSIFEQRSEFRMMSYKDYVNLGRVFYSTFSDKSKKEIGWMMSDHYQEMVGVTKVSFFPS